MRSTIFGMTLAAALVAPLAAQATIFQFNATLSGAKEQPPNNSTATGFSTLYYDDFGTASTADDAFSITTVANGLTSAPTNAHIHGPATTTETASPMVDLWNAPATRFTTANSFFGGLTAAAPAGTFSNANHPTAMSLLQVLNAGLAYVNVHTTQFPNGEVRGQLLQVQAIPEPGTYALMLAGLGLVGWAAGRRRSR